MTKQLIIEDIVKKLNRLSKKEAEEIALLIDAHLEKTESEYFMKNIQKLASESEVFNFLNEDTVEYKISDLKEIYNSKR